MKLSEIYDLLDKFSPFNLQESWDNSGLIVGDLTQEIDKIVLSIDVDDELVELLDDKTLLITHHPLIFSGLKQMDFAKYPANLIQKMIKKGVSNIAMHTNFDITHLNKYVATEVLGYEIESCDDFIIYLNIDEDFDTFSKKISKIFKISHLRVVKCNQHIKKVALTTGSGCSLIPKIEVDCFLTGDIKYHDAMQAKALNLSLIDIGHYESEQFFAKILEQYLKNLGLEAIITQSKNPFTYI